MPIVTHLPLVPRAQSRMWVTMGIPSNGEYGIPKEVMFGYPVTCEGGEYKIVEGISIDEFSQECINKTLKELTDEQDGVKHLL
jgi:malate dehydrogenase